MANLFLKGPLIEISVSTWRPVLDGPLSIRVAACSPCDRSQAQREKEGERERERERERLPQAKRVGGADAGGWGPDIIRGPLRPE